MAGLRLLELSELVQELLKIWEGIWVWQFAKDKVRVQLGRGAMRIYVRGMLKSLSFVGRV